MKTVLIAKDGPDMQDILSSSMQEFGHKTILADDGKEAWEILESGVNIDLLITDMRMPNMNGRELVEHINKDEKFNHLPIIIISGYTKEETITDLLDRSSTAFIPEPVTLGTLEEHTRRYLEA